MVDAQCGDRGATRIMTRPVAFKEITALFLTNAAGPIYLARIFLDLVRDGPGIVAFMTSGLDSVANDTGGGSELYRASKAALNSLARSPAARLGGGGSWLRGGCATIWGPSQPLCVDARSILHVLEARRGSRRHGGRELGVVAAPHQGIS